MRAIIKASGSRTRSTQTREKMRAEKYVGKRAKSVAWPYDAATAGRYTGVSRIKRAHDILWWTTSNNYPWNNHGGPFWTYYYYYLLTIYWHCGKVQISIDLMQSRNISPRTYLKKTKILLYLPNYSNYQIQLWIIRTYDIRNVICARSFHVNSILFST